MAGVLLGAFIAWLAVPWVEAVFFYSIPASRWFEVESIGVADAASGEPHRVEVDRRIKQAFTASWTVTVRREVEEGYAPVCARSGRSDYLPDSVFPVDTDINWWMNIPPGPSCPDLAVGRYILTMVWIISVEGMPPKVVREESNVFEVTP